MASIECDPEKICPSVVDQALGEDFTSCDARSEEVKPADIVPAITPDQFESLKNNTGIYNNGHDNCFDFTGQLLCDIRQDLEYVLQNKSMVIFANDLSKCSDDDDSPTLASMWSRLYRFAQATSAVLCGYDPFLNTLLKSGRYPQVLMGAVQEGGYPQWITPDNLPTEGSKSPVTSEGVIKGVKEALLAVWHVWEEHPSFEYFAQEYDGDAIDALTSQEGMEEGDTALVKTDGTDWNIIYKYTDGAWVKQEVLGPDGVADFSVTHILKGYWADKEMYAFFDTVNDVETWNVMDVGLGNLVERVEIVEKKYEQVVSSGDNENYVLTTAPTLADANKVPCTEGKETIVLITG